MLMFGFCVSQAMEQRKGGCNCAFTALLFVFVVHHFILATIVERKERFFDTITFCVTSFLPLNYLR